MTETVTAVTWDEVWRDFGPQRCDLLVLDTEGYDLPLLRAGAALSSFLRTGEAITGDRAREYLVLDPAFPRSMLHSARAAEESVRTLQTAGGDDELLREVGKLRSRLEFAGVPDDPEEVDRLAFDAQMSCIASGDAVAHAWFRQPGTIVWSH